MVVSDGRRAGALVCCWVSSLLLGMLGFAHGACMPADGCSVALAYYTFNSTIDGNLSTVAARFQANESEILWYSKLNASSAASMVSGQALRIPFRPCGCADGYLWHTFFYLVVITDDLASTIASDKYEFLTTLEAMTTANANDLTFIYPNNSLKIPVNCSCGDPSVSLSYGLFLTYVAEENDNADSLAAKFNISTDLLQSYNQGLDLNLLQEHVDILFVPSTDGNGVYPPFISISSNSNTKVIMGASVGAAILLLAIVGAVLFYAYIHLPRKRRKVEKYQTPPAPQIAMESSGPASHYSEESEYLNLNVGTLSDIPNFTLDSSVEFSYKELCAATDNFSIAKKIGQGGYGSVFYGELREQKLAIKMMNLQATREFLAELKVLTRVHHTNLVHLVGYCCTSKSLFVVYEYVDNGTLSQHLQYSGREGSTPLSWAARVQIALDAARGLEYIHEHTTPTYVHRDIKSSNILLDKSFHAKVADFGLTKLTESGTFSKLVGTFGYMAPEYALFGRISAKADVYAFGVVLFEIISGKAAIVFSMDKASATLSQGLVELFAEVLSDTVDGKEKLQSLVDPALLDDYPLESVWKMANLAGSCTREDPLLRPNMRVVVVALMTLMSSRTGQIDHSMEGLGR